MLRGRARARPAKVTTRASAARRRQTSDGAKRTLRARRRRTHARAGAERRDWARGGRRARGRTERRGLTHDLRRRARTHRAAVPGAAIARRSAQPGRGTKHAGRARREGRQARRFAKAANRTQRVVGLHGRRAICTARADGRVGATDRAIGAARARELHRSRRTRAAIISAAARTRDSAQTSLAAE